MNSIRRSSRLVIGAGVLVTGLMASTATIHGQTLAPEFQDDYTLVNLGSVPGLPGSYGGLAFLPSNPNILYIGGAANTANGRIYRIEVERNAQMEVIGFLGDATAVGEFGANNDGGVAFGPGGVLFLARYPQNELGQVLPGGTVEASIIDLGTFGVPSSVGGVQIVPAGFPGAGRLKTVSWSGGAWWDFRLNRLADGTYELLDGSQVTILTGGPEGMVYISGENPGFSGPSLLVSDYSSGRVSAYEIDSMGNPVIETRRDVLTGLTGAEGATIDPLTGDFLFSTFGGGNQVIAVRGFTVPPDLSRLVFDFIEDEQGWTWNVPPDYSDEVNGVRNPAKQSLDVQVRTNVNGFGYWESPLISVLSPAKEVETIYEIAGDTGPNALFRTTFNIDSSLADPSIAPVIRVRSSTEDFRRSDLVVATATAGGDFSPSTAARDYVLHFIQPEGQNRFRLDVDILAFDPQDAESLNLSINQVVVEYLGTAELGDGTIVASYDFVEGGTQGWEALPEVPIVPEPAVYSSANGLLIRGVELTRQNPIYPAVIFGYWGFDSPFTISGNTVYNLRWTVASDATEENKAQLPTIRLRVNDSALQYSALTAIDSVNATADVPTEGSPQTYDMWLITPGVLAGRTWMLSFDYLYVDKSVDPSATDLDDPSLALILQSLEVRAFGLPVK